MEKGLLKKTLLCLALSGLGAVAWAAPPNPYGDVALTEWEYPAIAQLKESGIIDKYAENFSTAKTSTREEMARMVARAVWNREKASQQDKAVIDKLGEEFAPELGMLGVYAPTIPRTTKVLGEEEGAKANVTAPPGPKPERWDDKFTLHGYFHISDQFWRNSGVYQNGGESFYPNDGNQPEMGLNLFMTYKINDKWTVHMEDEATREFRTGSYALISADGTQDKSVQQTNLRMEQLYVQGKIGKTDVIIGKWDYIPAYGAVMSLADRAVNGIQLAHEFPKGWKVLGTYGYLRENWAGAPLNPYFISYSENNRYGALEVDKKLNDRANVKGAYHRIVNDGSGEAHNLYEIGADTLLSNTTRIWGTYERSNADDNNYEYMAGIDFGRAELDKPHTQRLSLRYIYSGAHSGVGQSIDYWVASPVTYAHGFKGLQLNYQYMLDKNLSLMLWGSDLTPTDGTTGHLRTLKSEMDYFF